MPPASSFAPALDGLVDPGLDALGGVLADQRADVGGVVRRVAGDLRLDGRDDLRHQPVVDGGVGDHPLHRDAGLAALVVGEGGDAAAPPSPGPPRRRSRRGRRPRRCRRAPGCSACAAPSPGSRSRPCSEPVKEMTGSRSSWTSAGIRSLGTGRTRPGAGRQLGLGEQLAEDQAGERGGRGGLEDDRGADRDGRGDLVGAEVQREVERRDAQDRAAREAAGQREPAGAARVGVQALRLAAVEAAGLLGGEAEDGDGPADLAAGPLHGLAVLRGDQPGDLLGALDQPAVHMVERGGPYVRGGGGELVLDGDGGGDGLLDLRLGGDAHRADEASVPGGGDIEGGLAGGLAAGEPEGGGGCISGDRHSGTRPFRSGG